MAKKQVVKVKVAFDVYASVPLDWDIVHLTDRINETLSIEVDSEDQKISFRDVEILAIDIE